MRKLPWIFAALFLFTPTVAFVSTPLVSASASLPSVSVVNDGAQFQYSEIAPVDNSPFADVVVSPDSKTAYLTEPSTGEVAVLDLENETFEAPIDLGAGSEPQGLDISPDGNTLYICEAGTQQISEVNIASEAISTLFTAPASFDGTYPWQIAVGTNGTAIFTTTTNDFGTPNAYLLNLTTGAEANIYPNDNDVITTQSRIVRSNDRSTAVIASDDTSAGEVGTYSFTTNAASSMYLNQFVTYPAVNGDGSVMALETGASSYFLNTNSQSILGTVTENLPGGRGVVLNNAGTQAFRLFDNSIQEIDTSRYETISSLNIPLSTTGEGQLFLSPDGATLLGLMSNGVAVVQVGAFPASVARTPSRIYGDVVVSPDSSTAYFTVPSDDEVAVQNLATGRFGSPIEVGSVPEGLDISPDGSTLYICDSGSDEISVVDTATGVVTKTIVLPADLGGGASQNPRWSETTWQIVIGDNNTALFTTTNFAETASSGAFLLNLDTDSVTPAIYIGNGRTIANNSQITRTKDHSIVAVADSFSGDVFIYNFSTGVTKSVRPPCALQSDCSFYPAINDNGTQLLINGIPSGTNATQTNIASTATTAVEASIGDGGYGVTFGTDGTGYSLSGPSVFEINLAGQSEDGALALPDGQVGSGQMVSTPNGNQLVAITSSGSAILDLGNPSTTTGSNGGGSTTGEPTGGSGGSGNSGAVSLTGSTSGVPAASIPASGPTGMSPSPAGVALPVGIASISAEVTPPSISLGKSKIPKLRISTSKAAFLHFTFPVSITCTVANCSGIVTLSTTVELRTHTAKKVTIKRETLVLASKHYSLRENRSDLITLSLTAFGRKLVSSASDRQPSQTKIVATVAHGKTASLNLSVPELQNA